METPRSFHGQIFGYSILFGFYILLTMGTPVRGEENTKVSNPDSSIMPSVVTESIVTSEPMENGSKTSLPEDHPHSSLTSPTVLSEATELSPKISSRKETNLTVKKSPQHQPPPKTEELASQHEEKVSEPLVPFTTTLRFPAQSSTSAEQGTIPPAINTQSTIGQSIIITTKAGIIEKPLTTTGGVKAKVNTTLRSKFDLKPSEKPRPTEKETKRTTTSRQHVPDDNEKTSSTTHSSITVAFNTNGSELNSSEPQSSGNSHTGIILAVVFCVLFLLVIVAFLFRRRQRRSGSTNFNAAGWAGQVALPDDSGLDRDTEQGAVTGPAGEKETRRNTLVTFFGKRQSRVPSVAMEDISGKGEQEECQQLLNAGAGTACIPEGTGEANGKLAEGSMKSSQEVSASSTARESS
uniref:Leukosialin n=1 Tax=Pogona vitticeps TaxID=103695 RepID=A0A6J0U5R7_9SAUR